MRSDKRSQMALGSHVPSNCGFFSMIEWLMDTNMGEFYSQLIHHTCVLEL